MTDLVEVARSFFAPGKGILAADESTASANKRLELYGIPANEEMRRKDRILFLNCDGIEQYLTGVILFSETFGQKGSDRMNFENSLSKRGIAPGIKVDEGLEPFPSSPKESITKGLIGLPERLADFKKRGAVFTKWRAVVTIEGDQLPTAPAILENCKRLATYAKEAQMAGLVPILEPEVLLSGKHSRKQAQDAIRQTMTTLFRVLDEQVVDRASLILKTAMALSGKESGKKDTPEEVAQDTVSVLIETVPAQIAGIVFLSGGQTPEQATENLAAIERRAHLSHEEVVEHFKAISKHARERGAPWPMTFSYARALQEEALETWKGDDENLTAARKVYLARLKKVSDTVA